MWEKYFRIADHLVMIKGVDSKGEQSFPNGFDSFKRIRSEARLPLFTLETGVVLSTESAPANYTFLFEELDLTCEFAVTDEYYEFRMFPAVETAPHAFGIKRMVNPLRKNMIFLKMPRGGSYYTTNLLPTADKASEFSFLFWNAYAAASASLASVAIHSSVIIYRGKAVLFLGESGTGKSTHTRLWLKTIRDCGLLNDDSPIVRVMENTPVCYGSPWSGKGNCYRNESYPIAAIVRLQQSPSNCIRKLNKIEAFSALYPSCPPSFSCDAKLTDHVCNTLSVLIEKIPVYLLDCLPDSDAALLACTTIFGPNDINVFSNHE